MIYDLTYINLEKTKTTQKNKIDSLQRRVKKLEKRNRSRTHKLKRLYKVGLSARIGSTGEKESLEQEVVSTTATTETITTEEITLAQALEALKTSKPKVKEIVFHEPCKSTTTTISSKQSQEKGKRIMMEEPVKPKKKDQIRLDEEAALKLQAEFDKEERLARERAKKEQDSNIVLIEHGMIFKQRLMLIIIWLKECKHKNKKSCLMQKRLHYFNNSAFKRVNTFEDIKTELVKGKEKRAGKELIQEKEVAIDAIPLAVKSSRIIDWKIHKEGNKSYYQIVRVDGKSQMYMIFSQMLKSSDREELKNLYKLVKARYGSTRPVDGMDYLLWSDMKTMFEPHVEDEMLVEKKYPLTPPTLSMMLEKKLQIDFESKMAYQLCKLIKKQLKK
nr:hypothetical protein [Tanacetum cinerariifolium]